MTSNENFSNFYQREALKWCAKALKAEDLSELEIAVECFSEAACCLELAVTFEVDDCRKSFLNTMESIYKTHIVKLRSRVLTGAFGDSNHVLSQNCGGFPEQPSLELNSMTPEKPNLKWEDVIGLESAKDVYGHCITPSKSSRLKEAIVLPSKYPHLFNEHRKPWSRILLYGPPGTGKTKLAKLVASVSDAKFFAVSSADLMSCWFGSSEKQIKELFTEARRCAPSILFFDEIDSLCRARNMQEDEHNRRIKNELLRQLDGIASLSGVVILGSTNCPWELDKAVLRRFEKRIYIPLQDAVARASMFKLHLASSSSLTEEEYDDLGEMSDGYSGSDIAIVANDAMLQPVRELETATHWKKTRRGTFMPSSTGTEGAFPARLGQFSPQQISVRCVTKDDVKESLKRNTATVSPNDVVQYEDFTNKFGQNGVQVSDQN